MPSASISGGAVRCRINQALQFYIGNASDAGQETELASSGSPMRYGLAAAEDAHAKAAESHESSPMELSDTR
jgi:hypothetical protein